MWKAAFSCAAVCARSFSLPSCRTPFLVSPHHQGQKQEESNDHHIVGPPDERDNVWDEVYRGSSVEQCHDQGEDRSPRGLPFLNCRDWKCHVCLFDGILEAG